MESTGRIFKCALCCKQVLICRFCDRGQRYCSPDCSNTARKQAQKASSHRYQQSRLGRSNHAHRMRNYRRRKQIVTHQGSELSIPNDLLQANPADSSQPSVISDQPVATETFQCHFCSCLCSEFIRLDFLQRRRVRYFNPFDTRGNRNDHSP